MINRKLSMGVWFSMIGSCISSSFGAGANSPDVRNIVFILIDDLGVKDLGCYGSDYYETPNCNRLADEGMRFTEAYSAHSICSPTRASILTGRNPARLHLTAYIPGQECPNAKLKPPDWIKYLRLNETTYAETLRDAGFATCHIGKWHVSPVFGPEKQGFETVTKGRHDHNNAADDPWFVQYYTEAAQQFIEKNKNRPFLLTLSHGTVHVPHYEKEDLIEKYRRKKPGSNGQNNPVYAAMVERMDWSVGQILDKLKELGLDRNTAVVFTSDNGGLMNVYDKEKKKRITATSNLPYRGGKSQLYEGGIRVPLIIKWPGVTKPGSECSTPVISTDLYPTFLAMAGLPQRPAQTLDGLNLAPLLRGGDHLNRDCLYWHYPHYQSMPPHGAIRWKNWKLIEHYEDGRVELFNLANDPGETKNLATAFPERARQMQARFHDHLKAVGAQMPTPNPDYNPDIYWRKGSTNGSYDQWERKQDDDPRKYIENPGTAYGAGRDINGGSASETDPYTPPDAIRKVSEKKADQKLPNVLIIGDSISIQYMPVVSEALKGIANVTRPFKPNGKPVNCGSTVIGLREIDQWLGTNQWDVIHFNWGLHDLCYRNPAVTNIYGCRDKIGGTRSVSINQYRSNLEKLVARLKKTGADLIWASTTMVPSGEAGRFQGDEVVCNRVAEQIMKKNGIAVDDLYPLSSSFPDDFFLAPGDVHYSEKGFQKLGEQVAGAIRKDLNTQHSDREQNR